MAKKRTSMREVAAEAGVAMSSVSRVLSGHPDVSDDMRERVMRAVERLGYQPDVVAQSLRAGASVCVGFVVGDISNPLIAEIALGAESELQAAGYSMLLTNSENDPELDAHHIALLHQRRVDGLLLSLAAEDHPGTLALLADSDLPVVLIDRELRQAVAECPPSAVLSDHRSGVTAATGHLLDLGHRRIGLILGRQARFARERRLGVSDAYEQRGLAPTWTVVQGELEGTRDHEVTADLLDDAVPPTAIIVGGNQLLVGALRELAHRGLRIGKDISLVSCDATVLTELIEPAIAIVRRDMRELGKRAAELLLHRLQGRNAPRQVLLPTEFIPRASCGPPATSLLGDQRGAEAAVHGEVRARDERRIVAGEEEH